jgi:hypothetical protein
MMRVASCFAFCLALTACSPKISDTGYVGTWARGKVESRSIISISKAGDQYRFHWKLVSLDGKWTVACDKAAHCVETFEGKKIGDYDFSTHVDAATGHLIVESNQISYEPDGKVRRTTHDVDELVVEQNGLSLGCYTFERNGQKMSREEGPQRHFEKIADTVMEPGS